MPKEVIVIGGGIIGSSITYHLAKDGVKVRQLEKGSIANQGAASRVSAGGVRLNNRDVRELELAKESIKRWQSLEEELEADLEYFQTGQIMLFDHRYSLEELINQVKEDENHGISARIVEQDELKELAPYISTLFTKAIFYPYGGQANALLTTIAFSSASRRLGAEIMTGVEVYSIETEENKVLGVKTSEGFFPSDVVINAAGAWAPILHQTIGSTLPQIKPYCHQMSATFAAPLKFMGPTISAEGKKISLKQTIDGRIRAGGGYSAKPGPDPYTGLFNQESLDEQRNVVTSIIPDAENYPVDFIYHGVEAHSVDDIPILGPVPEVEGYILATGFSGHGFTLSPGIGQVISDIVQQKPNPISIEEFSITRSFDTESLKNDKIRHIPG